MEIRIIDYLNELNTFSEEIDNKDIILEYVTLNDIEHPINSELSCLFINIINQNIYYIIPIKHSECLNLINIEQIIDILNQCKNIYTYNKKSLLQVIKLSINKKIYDLNLMYYLRYNDEYYANNDELYIQYNTSSRLIYNTEPFKYNYYIPLSRLIEYGVDLINNDLKIYNSRLKNIENTDYYIFYNDLILETLTKLENNGIYCDKNVLKEVYGEEYLYLNKNNMLYSQYNIYTNTGRPSNRFGNINFSALNKEDDSRKIIQSRFDQEGMLMEIDFDAYHLNLIALMMNYKKPNDITFHEYLGRQYFNKSKLTEQEYKESKQQSFKIIYGGHAKEFLNILYFFEINNYINKIWNEFEREGMIVSKESKKILYKENYSDMHGSKFFNYLIQLFEFEFTINKLIKKILEIDCYKSKIILYNYDSCLFDININEKDYLLKIKQLFDSINIQYKIKAGSNYSKMKSILN